LAKDPVYRAFPVNTMMWPVRLRANFAKRILFQAIKIELCPVTNVPVVVPPIQAVPNAVIVLRGRL
jgi:hypothetical protein